MSLSPSQLSAITTTERVSSVFSIVGALFVVGTFLASPAFHKPVNRMVFYASIGNIITNVATIISTSGVTAGQYSALCQTQSFIIQMFMPADSLWTFCMACNVYLTFRYRYSADQLRRLEWKYFLFCYGVPAIPAFIYLFIRTQEKGSIYGPATLWCWVSVPWNPLRIATFYGPVWLIFLVTILIYTTIGSEIYQKRKQLQSAVTMQSFNSIPEPPQEQNFGQDYALNSKTTEIHVVSESKHGNYDDNLDLPAPEGGIGRSSSNHDEETQQQYTVSISSNVKDQMRRPGGQPNNYMSASDAAAWAYTKCALLFFAALLITWVPSTINRLYSLVEAGDVSFALCYFEALVLPLQGFWNAIVYIATSISACKSLWRSICGGAKPSPAVGLSNMRYVKGFRKDTGTESMTRLASNE